MTRADRQRLAVGRMQSLILAGVLLVAAFTGWW